MRSVQTDASTQMPSSASLAGWLGLSGLLAPVAMGTAAGSLASVFPSRFHLPASLGSTGITRFIATMDALTPVPWLFDTEWLRRMNTFAVRDRSL